MEPASYQQSRRIFTALVVALSLTAVVMTGALTALAAGNWLQGCDIVPWLGVAGFVACLVSYLILIRLALGPKGKPVNLRH